MTVSTLQKTVARPAPQAEAATALLDVRGLRTEFRTDGGVVTPLLGVDFSVAPGETLALVGESGSGKSVTSLSIMGLLARPAGRIAAGSALFRTRDGASVDLARADDATLRRLRGRELAMIFQEPMTSLNPVLPVGEQIADAVRLHLGLDRQAALAHALRMLELVEIPAARQRLREYPHQMSGGMRQRVMIALALSCEPRLLIADEPTTALDVTIQAQILVLMRKLQHELGMGILFITHNLGVVAETAQRVAVMYAGRIVETGTVREVFKAPKHPYTRGLMECLPANAHRDERGQPVRLKAIPGQVAAPGRQPPGCAFAPRCAFAEPRCESAVPALAAVAPDHQSRCLRWSAL
ncbi:peptide/nickel transport system ATP-binding protein [Plasticicumulans lactativorans]|uniref:ABC-type dipeptide transporter n=1 Tax=Plasticicumulans lactativorans TaxID=1133106 RepID=A0A4R2L0Z7_9GAMM|nr:ABC transporter ATP-binding protein [Plasticicumulans lactativorans]TCO80104.1 peptide/nickel transport system ATP-binding protein [Plasticicumulans lactativorans]